MIQYTTVLILTLIPLYAQKPSRPEVLEAMKSAAAFYRNSVSTQGGYHYYYAEDLSYGRSEHGEGPTQIEVQREATPSIGMAYLEAWRATGDVFYLDAARDAALALVRGQLCSGGWGYIVEFDPQKRARYPYRVDRNCSAGNYPTTLDDNVTQAAVRLLMRVDKALGFKNGPIHEATLFALDSLVQAQYPNGAWPQRFTAFPDASRFPVKKASYPDSWPRKWPGEIYQLHYTFNDNSISDCIDMMLEAARVYSSQKYLDAARRGGDFILLAQMPEPQPAWAQQYDIDMHPAWARIFEPPSVTGGESQGILRTLMVLYRETGDRKYLAPVPRALAFLKGSRLPDGRIPRFLELRTNKPLYITKGTQIRAAGGGSARIDGYELSYDGSSVITHYGVVTSAAELPAIEDDYNSLAAQDPKTIRRSVDLSGLSPWSERPARAPSGSQIAKILQTIEPRGSWSEPGTIGKADRLVSLFAARPMVVTINGKQIAALKEDDTIEVFQGEQPPLQRILRSATFARNLLALSAYVK